MHPRQGVRRRAATLVRAAALGVVAIAALVPGQARAQVSEAELSESHRRWLELVAYIIEDREREIFEALGTAWQRERFIAEFWRRRDPLPVTPENEFYVEHMRRWRYANEVLGRDTPMPGWRTDRGRVYIVNGPPFKVHPYPNTQQLWPLEVWEYRDTPRPGMPSFYQIIFFKPRVFNEWRLYSPSVDGPEGLVISSPADLELINFQQLATKFPIVFTAATRVAAGYSTLESEAVIARTMAPIPPPRPLAFDGAAGEARAAFLSGGALSMNMEASGFVHEEAEGFLDVTVELETSAETFVEIGERLVANYEIELEITTDSAGTWRDPAGQFVVRIPRDEFEQVRGLPIVYRERLWLLPGRYHVRALVREVATGRFGVADVDAAIPEDADLVVGAPSLFYVTEGVRQDATSAIPWVRRTLRHGYSIGALARVARTTSPDASTPELELEYRMNQGDRVVWTDTWVGSPMAQRGGGWLAAHVLEIGALPVGDYELEVFARSRAAAGAPAVNLGRIDRRRLEIVDEFLPFARILPMRAAEPDLAHAHHAIGQQLLRANDFKAAGEHFRTAVRLAPQKTAYQIDAAKTLLMAGDVGIAEFFLEGAVQREPRNAEAWATFGLLRVRTADFDGAIEAYERSLDLAPGTPAVYNGLAEALLSTGQTVRALRMLELSLEGNPDQVPVRELRDRLRDGTTQDLVPEPSDRRSDPDALIRSREDH